MAKAHVLIVEDDGIVAEDIKNILENMGYGVSAIVPSGEGALIRVEEFMPDLVLMDIMLSGDMNGTEAASHIRSRFNIPVIYLTAYSDDDVLEKAKITEPFGYIVKPFEPRELNAAIEIALYKHKIEKELKETKEWLKTTLKSIGDAVIATDKEGYVTFMNPVAESMTGWHQEEGIGKALADIFNIINEETRDEIENPVSKVIREGRTVGLANNTLLIARDGTEILIDDSGAPIQNEHGNIIGVVLIFRDIREKRQAQEEINRSYALLNQIVSRTDDAIFIKDAQGKYTLANPATLKAMRRTKDAVIGKDDFEIFPKTAALLREGDREIMTSGKACTVEEETEVEGKKKYWLSTKTPNRDSKGNVIGIIGIAHDISERKQAENELRMAKEKTEQKASEATALLQCSRAVLMYPNFLDSAKNIFDISKALIQATSGYIALLTDDGEENEVLFLDSGGRPCTVDPSLPMPIRGLRAEAYRTGKAVYDNNFADSDWMRYMPQGHMRLENVMFAPLMIEGKACGLIGFANKQGGFDENDGRMATAFGEFAAIALNNSRSVELRKSAEEALQQKMLLNQALLDALPCVTLLIRPKTREVVASNKAGKDVGAVPGSLCYSTWGQRNDPCPWCLAPKLWEENQPQNVEVEGLGVIWDTYWIPVQDDLYLHYAFDISEKRKMETQLQQAHKMEAIGTLAGGIAHDFNNILGIIVGNAELSLGDIPEWNPAHQHLTEIRQSCLRARDVVRQLLSFARKEDQKQKPIQIAPIVKESLKLLRSSIPTSIDIQHHISANSETLLGDPTQIHQVLLNLCINAADAMFENGGVLEIRLDTLEIDEHSIDHIPELEHGQYLKLTVSDTGEGIPADIKGRIFDPYFTTKETGKGTGMGLAVVHGIVENHNGVISVKSEPERGTTFDILFPIIEEREKENIIPEEIKGGNEKILFVDDEEAMVRIGTQGLENLGYHVVGTTDPVEAIELFKADIDSFHLVISDMTMPGMTGNLFAKKLMEIRPNVPVILCTGYNEKIDKMKAEEIGVHSLLIKPLVMSEIAQAIRSVLEEGKQEISTKANSILVVDDEEQMRSKLRLMLESEGFDVFEAPDGRIALWLYKEKPADLIILDILMPEKEGLETITELKREFPDVKIIAISGGGTGDAGQYLDMAKKMGANSTLAKPFEKEELLEAVKNLLG